MRWALVIALAVMTGLYMDAVGVLETQRAHARFCSARLLEAEVALQAGQGPLTGWEEFDRERVS